MMGTLTRMLVLGLLTVTVSGAVTRGEATPNDELLAARVTGAGQRLHLSFGGDLTLRGNNRLAGEFVVVGAPQSPVGTMLTFTCRYRQFSDAQFEGIQVRFTGRGQCVRLATNGSVTEFSVTTQFRIVDNGNNDVIEAKMVGSTGISIPVGTLSFGDFVISGT
jgi:hypothetical protein